VTVAGTQLDLSSCSTVCRPTAISHVVYYAGSWLPAVQRPNYSVALYSRRQRQLRRTCNQQGRRRQSAQLGCSDRQLLTITKDKKILAAVRIQMYAVKTACWRCNLPFKHTDIVRQVFQSCLCHSLFCQSSRSLGLYFKSVSYSVRFKVMKVALNITSMFVCLSIIQPLRLPKSNKQGRPY